MIVEIEWTERNRYRDSVLVNENDVRAAGLDPNDAGDVMSYLDAHESEWVDRIDDFNAAHQAVEERRLVAVTEVDLKTGVLT